jgi:hypothetical protein
MNDREQFEAWAKKEGFDTANTYDTDRSKWVWLNPMTTDLWCAWSAARATPAQPVPSESEQVNLLRNALYLMLQQFTGTPSTLADSEARCTAHAALKATAVKPQPSPSSVGAAIPEGWQLVPTISTSKMDRAGEDAYEQNGHCDCGNANGCGMEAVFSAMLAAAPSIAQDGQKSEGA